MDKVLRLAAAAWLLTLLAACDPAENAPYVAFEGGGFVFNYRTAEAYYGFNLRPMRRLPPGTHLLIELENPAGGPPLVETFTVEDEQLRYTFRTPPLDGIVAGRPYRVVVHVLEKEGGRELARYERSYASDLDQSELPEVPPVLGPGYQLNPDSELGRKP